MEAMPTAMRVDRGGAFSYSSQRPASTRFGGISDYSDYTDVGMRFTLYIQ